MTNYFLDNPMYIGTSNAHRFSAGYYRNYTLNIACGTLDWGISFVYHDSGDFISYDLRICAQHPLPKSCYSQYSALDSTTISQCPTTISFIITA